MTGHTVVIDGERYVSYREVYGLFSNTPDGHAFRRRWITWRLRRGLREGSPMWIEHDEGPHDLLARVFGPLSLTSMSEEHRP